MQIIGFYLEDQVQAGKQPLKSPNSFNQFGCDIMFGALDLALEPDSIHKPFPNCQKLCPPIHEFFKVPIYDFQMKNPQLNLSGMTCFSPWKKIAQK
jgi:hypothetical protein